jgi:predicted CopG family antitoxin
MASRTVALDDEAYGLLKARKQSEESFSDTVKRLARPRRPLSDFAGMWSDMTAKERKELDRVFADMRKAESRRAALLGALSD